MTLTLCVQAGINGRKPELRARTRVSTLNAQTYKMIHTIADTNRTPGYTYTHASFLALYCLGKRNIFSLCLVFKLDLIIGSAVMDILQC